MSKISFVYFDVGGVVIKDFSDSNKWQQLLSVLGITPEKATLFEQLWHKYNTRICLDLDVDALIPEFSSKLNLSLPSSSSILDEFVIRFEQNQSIWPTIQNYHQKSKVGLLTNMYPRMFKKIQNKNLLPPTSWDDIIDSSAVGVQKPDPQIFNLAQQRADVPADQILFVDNSEKNINAANNLGWQTFLYDSNDYETSSAKLSKFLSTQTFAKRSSV